MVQPIVAATDVMADAATPEITGGVESFDTVTVTAVEVLEFPAASFATAVSECDPAAAAVVFHEIA